MLPLRVLFVDLLALHMLVADLFLQQVPATEMRMYIYWFNLWKLFYLHLLHLHEHGFLHEAGFFHLNFSTSLFIYVQVFCRIQYFLFPFPKKMW